MERCVELKKKGKFRDNVIFSAYRGPQKSLLTYFHSKFKKKKGGSAFFTFIDFGIKNAFFAIVLIIDNRANKTGKLAKKNIFF